MIAEELIDFEKRIEKLYREAKIRGPVHLSGGNEKQLIDIFKEIKKEDWVFSNYRNHYHALLKGIPKKWLEEEIKKGNSIHIMNKEYKFFSSSIVPGQLPIALGVALGLKLKNASSRVWAFCGDMAAETGTFHEVTKYAINHNLPINFVVEDNGLSVYTPTREVWGINSKEMIPGFVSLKNNVNKKIRRYKYKRSWPHHGIGMWVEFPEEKKEKRWMYRDELKRAMNILAKNEKVIFLGQTVKYKGSALYQTLEDIVDEKKIELPIMEDVQMGMSIGLSLEGFIPVSIYPRFDFLILATNQMVNHLDKIRELSSGQFDPKVIIRTAVGSKIPLNPGPQHCQDYTEAYRIMLKNVDIIRLDNYQRIVSAYLKALESNKSSLLVEIGDLYSS